MHIKKLFPLISIFLGFYHALLSGQTNETYSDSSDMLGIDGNAGKNSFLSLLIYSGGKMEAMAGTHTAMALDNSILEANPAGASFIEYGYLGFSHVNWISDSALETISYSVRSQKNESLGLAFNARFFHVPFKGYDLQGNTVVRDGKAAVGSYNEIISSAAISWKFLESFYFGGVSVGTTLKLGYRALSETIYRDQDSFALMGDIGVMTRFNFLKIYSARDMNFSVGMTLKNLGAEFIQSPDPLPTYASVGIAYKIIKPLTIAMDYNLPFNLDSSAATQGSFSMGLNADITSFLSVQTGVLIKTGKPRFALGVEISLDTLSLQANYTLDLLSLAEPFDRLSISLRINIDKLRGNILRDMAQKIYVQGLDLYSRGKLEEAIKLWRECLDIDPGFSPAFQMITVVNKEIERQKSLKDKILK